MGLFSRMSGLSGEEPVEADVVEEDEELEEEPEPAPEVDPNEYWEVDVIMEGGRSKMLQFGRDGAYAGMEEEALACADDILNYYRHEGVWVSKTRKTRINRSKVVYVTVNKRTRRR